MRTRSMGAHIRKRCISVARTYAWSICHIRWRMRQKRFRIVKLIMKGRVQVDSSCYAIPPPDNVAKWVAQVPKGFMFHFKAFGLFCAQVRSDTAFLTPAHCTYLHAWHAWYRRVQPHLVCRGALQMPFHEVYEIRCQRSTPVRRKSSCTACQMTLSLPSGPVFMRP